MQAAEDQWGGCDGEVEPLHLAMEALLRLPTTLLTWLFLLIGGTYNGVEATITPHVASRAFDSQASLQLSSPISHHPLGFLFPQGVTFLNTPVSGALSLLCEIPFHTLRVGFAFSSNINVPNQLAIRPKAEVLCLALLLYTLVPAQLRVLRHLLPLLTPPIC